MCIRDRDELYRTAFPTEDLRKQLEELEPAGAQASGGANDADAHERSSNAGSSNAGGAQAGSASGPGGAATATSAQQRAPAARSRRASRDHQGEALAAAARAKLRQRLRAAFLERLNRAIAPAGDMALLEKLEAEVKALPTPCTRAQMRRACTAWAAP